MEIKVNGDYRIREWCDEDALMMAQCLNNRNIWNNCRDRLPYPYTLDDARQYIKYTNTCKEETSFCIEVEGRAVGSIVLINCEDVNSYNAELGYWLAQEYWNRGILSSALADVLEYFWCNSRIVRIYAEVFAFNLASQCVLEKNGFTRCAVSHKAVFKNGQFVDEYSYELLRKQGFVTFRRCDSKDPDFHRLVLQLDNELNERNGIVRQSVYDKYNNVEDISTIVVAYFDGNAAGCGCFRPNDSESVEIKRMFVCPEYRRKGISALVLGELHRWAKELGFHQAVLETGVRHFEAVSLYKSSGYKIIDNYGPYKNLTESICMGRPL